MGETPLSDEDIEALGKPYKEPLQMSKQGGADPAEIQKLADTLKLTPAQVLQKFPHLSEGEQQFSYKGKGDVSVSEKSPVGTKRQGEVWLTSSLPHKIRLDPEFQGMTEEQAASKLKSEGAEVRKDRALRKSKASRTTVEQ
jgi:hypothetical protein